MGESSNSGIAQRNGEEAQGPRLSEMNGALDPNLILKDYRATQPGQNGTIRMRHLRVCHSGHFTEAASSDADMQVSQIENTCAGTRSSAAANHRAAHFHESQVLPD